MRTAPSIRMTSPLSITFSIICPTSAANSEGRPRRAGNSASRVKDSRTASETSKAIGVSKTPGATVMTRMPKRASSRASGSVIPTTLALTRGPVLRHRLGGQARDVERADQIDLDALREEVQRVDDAVLIEHPARSDDARAVDDTQQAAAKIEGGLDARLDLRRTGHVRERETHPLAEFGHKALAILTVDVCNDDLPADLGDHPHVGATQAEAAASDKKCAALDLHGYRAP